MLSSRSANQEALARLGSFTVDGPATPTDLVNFGQVQKLPQALGAGLAALGLYVVTGARIWLAIAQLTGFLNLFNLIPVWQLDGSRGLHVLARSERWVLVAAIALALVITGQRLLFIVGGVAVWRSFQHETGPGDARVLATFVVLIFALSLLARGLG